jgi:hypothetical protein
VNTESPTNLSVKTVTALFGDRQSAERGYRSARQLGIEESEIVLMMSDETRRRCFPDDGRHDSELGNRANEGSGKAAEGSELGGPMGGTLGTIAPAAAAVGTVLLIPGIIFAGPVAIALAAAGVVGLATGLVGALANWGIPSERAEEYELDIRKGSILMGVKTRNEEDVVRLQQRWRDDGGRLAHA